VVLRALFSSDHWEFFSDMSVEGNAFESISWAVNGVRVFLLFPLANVTSDSDSDNQTAISRRTCTLGPSYPTKAKARTSEPGQNRVCVWVCVWNKNFR